MAVEIAVVADEVTDLDEGDPTRSEDRRRPRFPGAYLPEVAAIALVLIWGSTFIVTKAAYSQILPLAYTSLRYSLASIISLVVLAIRGRHNPSRYWRIEPGDRVRFIWCGLLGTAFNQVFFSIGVDRTSAFASSLLSSILPLFSLAIVTVLGQRPSRQVWIGVWVSIAGVCLFLLKGDSESGMVGNILCLASAATFALYSELVQPLVRKYPAETVAAYTMTFGAVPLLGFAVPQLMAQDWGSLDPSVWVAIVYTATFPVYLALIVWNWIISERGVAATGWNLLVPIASGVMAVIVLGDAIGPIQIGGAALALLGLVLMQRESLGGRTSQAGRRDHGEHPATGTIEP
ncbi:MAG: DMT family transporter [Thermomicrobiales bacterium]